MPDKITENSVLCITVQTINGSFECLTEHDQRDGSREVFISDSITGSDDQYVVIPLGCAMDLLLQAVKGGVEKSERTFGYIVAFHFLCRSRGIPIVYKLRGWRHSIEFNFLFTPHNFNSFAVLFYLKLFCIVFSDLMIVCPISDVVIQLMCSRINGQQ